MPVLEDDTFSKRDEPLYSDRVWTGYRPTQLPYFNLTQRHYITPAKNYVSTMQNMYIKNYTFYTRFSSIKLSYRSFKDIGPIT